MPRLGDFDLRNSNFDEAAISLSDLPKAPEDKSSELRQKDGEKVGEHGSSLDQITLFVLSPLGVETGEKDWPSEHVHPIHDDVRV